MNGSPTPSNNQPKKFDESKLRFKTVFKYHENDGIINNKNTYTAKIYQNEIVIIDVNHNLKFTSTTRIPFSIVKNVDITDVIDRQGELYFKIETNERPLKSTDGGNEYLSSSNSEIIIANLAGGDDAETIRKNAANFKNAIEKALEEYKQTDEYQNEIKAKKENRNSDFYRKFKNKYGLDFEKWNEEKEIINLCRKEWDNVYSNYTIVIFKNSFFLGDSKFGKKYHLAN